MVRISAGVECPISCAESVGAAKVSGVSVPSSNFGQSDWVLSYPANWMRVVSDDGSTGKMGASDDSKPGV